MSGYEEKFTIPSFYGKIDTDAYLDWEKKMEFIFGCKHYTERKKVCLAVTGLCGSAFTWWQRVSQTRRFNGKPQPTTWVEMKILMKKRFVSQWELSELRPEAATKLTTLDQISCVFELPTKPAKKRQVVPDLSLKQEEEKLQHSLVASEIKKTEECHQSEPEPTTLCLKQEDKAHVECDHVPNQTKKQDAVLEESSEAPDVLLSMVDQGENFETLSCELLIKLKVPLQLSLGTHLRVLKGLQQVVFEPGGSLSISRRSNNNLVQKTVSYKFVLQGSFNPKEQDLRSNLFEGREDGVILRSCSKNKGGIGGKPSFIRFITDQHKLRREKQVLLVVKKKPELEDEYGDQTTRPPDQKEIKLRVHCLMFKSRTSAGPSWRETVSFKLFKVKESSALEVTFIKKSSKMLLRHKEGLQSFVFDPGETRKILIFLMVWSCTLEFSDQGSIIQQRLDLRTNPFKGRGDGAILIRLKLKICDPMYGKAKLLIKAWLNCQFHHLIGMIYEVLDREKDERFDTAWFHLFASACLWSSREKLEQETIQAGSEHGDQYADSSWCGEHSDQKRNRLEQLQQSDGPASLMDDALASQLDQLQDQRPRINLKLFSALFWRG